MNIELYFIVNALFFNEEYVSEIYHLEEKDTFFKFILRTTDNLIYTSIVGVVFSYIVDCFFVEEKKVKKIFKREKDDYFTIKYEISNLVRSLSNHYKAFIIFGLCISVFAWYYISCFYVVYPHMLFEWIKSTLVIIVIMQLLSIIATFLEAVFRFCGLKYKSERAFKTSLYFDDDLFINLMIYFLHASN